MDAKVLDIKTVTHNSQECKLVLLEDGNVYKIKKSKLEGNVKYVLKWVSFGSKDCTKELKLECAYFLGQTS